MRDLDLTEYERLPQWIPSQNGSEFCQFSDLSEEMRSQIRQEDKFTLTIDGLRYTVKDYNGKWLVFRRSFNTATKTGNKNSTSNILEIKIMPLVEANSHLQNEKDEYQIFGSDPVKIINNEVYVLMVKRSGETKR
jgi:hypothetical protein